MKYLIPFFMLLVLVSCTRTYYYGAGNFVTESSVLPKPVYRGERAKGTYLQGSYYHTLEDEPTEVNPIEFSSIQLGELSYIKSYTGKNINAAYSAIVHGGVYDANAVGEFNGGSKNFFGGGVTGELNLNIPFNRVDWRIIGGKFSMMYEGGDYYYFRKDVYKKYGTSYSKEDFNVINFNPRKLYVNFSLTWEVVYKLKNGAIGYWESYGGRDKTFVLGKCLYYTRRKLTGFIQINGDMQGAYLGGGLIFQID
ncbi:hypothetical protein [Chondrinema litorale]|uniref:hypothetical protein n=1 Tax=Chondrinema litorale TaxID=2994555 RepID=UPI00254361CC|nr:hypothetical protein [Chondrinema litorale]UZR95254.1 hypothetical protein OQ292_05405 [Chondrinema litorale]